MTMFARTVSFWRRLIGSGAPSSGSVKVAEERRRALRYYTDHVIQCRDATAEGPGRPAQLRDISAGGIRVVVEEEFRPGDLLSVQLPDDPPHPPTSVLACVVHVNPEADGRWAVGCTFSSELSGDDLHTFGTAPAGVGTDQRSQPRHQCAIEATYQLLADEAEPKRPARVLNISTTGVGLVVDQPVTVGKLLTVELQVQGPGPGLTVLCCAVHVREQGPGEWLLGCNFITELGEQELNQLLRR
jgi:hypothetical protein